MVLRTRIGPDGSIISDGGGDDSSSSGGSGGGGGRRRLCPTSVDTFGFHLELKHFAIVLLFISVTMGPIGSELLNNVQLLMFCEIFLLIVNFNMSYIFMCLLIQHLKIHTHHQLSYSCPSYQYTHTTKEDPTTGVVVEEALDGKMARLLEKILKELVIFPKHPRADEVQACVKRQHA